MVCHSRSWPTLPIFCIHHPSWGWPKNIERLPFPLLSNLRLILQFGISKPELRLLQAWELLTTILCIPDFGSYLMQELLRSQTRVTHLFRPATGLIHTDGRGNHSRYNSYLLKPTWSRPWCREFGEAKHLGCPTHKYWDGYQSGKKKKKQQQQQGEKRNEV